MNLLVKSILAAGIILPSSALYGQATWEVDPTDAAWGDVPTGRQTGGYYTRRYDHTLNDSFSHAAHGVLNDTVGGSVNARAGDTGVYTRLDTGSTFDLSTVGSSVQLRASYVFFGAYTNHSQDENHLYEIGLVAGDTYFGGGLNGDQSTTAGGTLRPAVGNPSDVTAPGGANPAVDALFIAGRETHVSTLSASNPLSTYEVVAFDEAGVFDGNLHDGIYTGFGNQLATLGSGLQLTKQNNSYDQSHANLITFTNVGSGNMQIDMEVRGYGWNETDHANYTTRLSTSVTVAHGMSAGSLANLHPGVGYRVTDSDVSITGATFDAVPVPEPSSSILVALAAGLTGMTRRRR